MPTNKPTLLETNIANFFKDKSNAQMQAYIKAYHDVVGDDRIKTLKNALTNQTAPKPIDQLLDSKSYAGTQEQKALCSELLEAALNGISFNKSQAHHKEKAQLRFISGHLTKAEKARQEELKRQAEEAARKEFSFTEASGELFDQIHDGAAFEGDITSVPTAGGGGRRASAEERDVEDVERNSDVSAVTDAESASSFQDLLQHNEIESPIERTAKMLADDIQQQIEKNTAEIGARQKHMSSNLKEEINKNAKKLASDHSITLGLTERLTAHLENMTTKELSALLQIPVESTESSAMSFYDQNSQKSTQGTSEFNMFVVNLLRVRTLEAQNENLKAYAANAMKNVDAPELTISRESLQKAALDTGLPFTKNLKTLDNLETAVKQTLSLLPSGMVHGLNMDFYEPFSTVHEGSERSEGPVANTIAKLAALLEADDLQPQVQALIDTEKAHLVEVESELQKFHKDYQSYQNCVTAYKEALEVPISQGDLTVRQMKNVASRTFECNLAAFTDTAVTDSTGEYQKLYGDAGDYIRNLEEQCNALIKAKNQVSNSYAKAVSTQDNSPERLSEHLESYRNLKLNTALQPVANWCPTDKTDSEILQNTYMDKRRDAESDFAVDTISIFKELSESINDKRQQTGEVYEEVATMEKQLGRLTNQAVDSMRSQWVLNQFYQARVNQLEAHDENLAEDTIILTTEEKVDRYTENLTYLENLAADLNDALLKDGKRDGLKRLVSFHKSEHNEQYLRSGSAQKSTDALRQLVTDTFLDNKSDDEKMHDLKEACRQRALQQSDFNWKVMCSKLFSPEQLQQKATKNLLSKLRENIDKDYTFSIKPLSKLQSIPTQAQIEDAKKEVETQLKDTTKAADMYEKLIESSKTALEILNSDDIEPTLQTLRITDGNLCDFYRQAHVQFQELIKDTAGLSFDRIQGKLQANITAYPELAELTGVGKQSHFDPHFADNVYKILLEVKKTLQASAEETKGFKMGTEMGEDLNDKLREKIENLEHMTAQPPLNLLQQAVSKDAVSKDKAISRTTIQKVKDYAAAKTALMGMGPRSSFEKTIETKIKAVAKERDEYTDKVINSEITALNSLVEAQKGIDKVLETMSEGHNFYDALSHLQNNLNTKALELQTEIRETPDAEPIQWDEDENEYKNVSEEKQEQARKITRALAQSGGINASTYDTSSLISPDIKQQPWFAEIDNYNKAVATLHKDLKVVKEKDQKHSELEKQRAAYQSQQADTSTKDTALTSNVEKDFERLFNQDIDILLRNGREGFELSNTMRTLSGRSSKIAKDIVNTYGLPDPSLKKRFKMGQIKSDYGLMQAKFAKRLAEVAKDDLRLASFDTNVPAFLRDALKKNAALREAFAPTARYLLTGGDLEELPVPKNLIDEFYMEQLKTLIPNEDKESIAQISHYLQNDHEEMSQAIVALLAKAVGSEDPSARVIAENNFQTKMTAIQNKAIAKGKHFRTVETELPADYEASDPELKTILTGLEQGVEMGVIDSAKAQPTILELRQADSMIKQYQANDKDPSEQKNAAKILKESVKHFQQELKQHIPGTIALTIGDLNAGLPTDRQIPVLSAGFRGARLTIDTHDYLTGKESARDFQLRCMEMLSNDAGLKDKQENTYHSHLLSERANDKLDILEKLYTQRSKDFSKTAKNRLRSTWGKDSITQEDIQGKIRNLRVGATLELEPGNLENSIERLTALNDALDKAIENNNSTAVLGRISRKDQLDALVKVMNPAEDMPASKAEAEHDESLDSSSSAELSLDARQKKLKQLLDPKSTDKDSLAVIFKLGQTSPTESVGEEYSSPLPSQQSQTDPIREKLAAIYESIEKVNFQDAELDELQRAIDKAATWKPRLVASNYNIIAQGRLQRLDDVMRVIQNTNAYKNSGNLNIS